MKRVLKALCCCCWNMDKDRKEIESNTCTPSDTYFLVASSSSYASRCTLLPSLLSDLLSFLSRFRLAGSTPFTFYYAALRRSENLLARTGCVTKLVLSLCGFARALTLAEFCLGGGFSRLQTFVRFAPCTLLFLLVFSLFLPAGYQSAIR
jgi:hypothetical protein